MAFPDFLPVAPIPADTITAYQQRVPAEVSAAWEQHGAGFLGDGYFRFVDPARADAMMGTVRPVPDDAVVLFATAMADLVVWWQDMYLVVKTRLGEIHAASIPFEALVTLMGSDPEARAVAWDWEPYPQAVQRLGVPAFEQCLMHVPILAMGGRGDPATMDLGSLWVHLDLMLRMAGPPTFTHMLPLPAGW